MSYLHFLNKTFRRGKSLVSKTFRRGKSLVSRVGNATTRSVKFGTNAVGLTKKSRKHHRRRRRSARN